MLFVDGTGSGAFWREAVTLAANTTYSFTYFVTGADSRNLPNIALTLNGDVLEAGFQVSADGGKSHWQEAVATFTTGASGNYVLAMSDNGGQPLGNDFTVDDLSLVLVGGASGRPASAVFHPLEIASIHGLEVHHLAIA